MAHKKLTELELACVANYRGNQLEAAKAAGVKNYKRHASKIFNRPHVRAAVEKKISAMIAQSGEELGKTIAVTRTDIFNGLAKEAREGESDAARVSAWSKLADIFRMGKGKEVDLNDWTDEELTDWSLHGKLPIRLFAVSESTVNGQRADDHGKPTDNPGTSGRSTQVPGQG